MLRPSGHKQGRSRADGLALLLHSPPRPMCEPTVCRAHLTSTEVQVQVIHVRVECEAFQKRPGRGCHRGWLELGKGAPGRERIARRKGQDAREVMGVTEAG